MKFTLIIDKECDEEIIAKVHSASEFTSKIENLAMSYSGKDEIIVQGDYELLTLKFDDVECITLIERKLFVIDSNGNKYRISGTLSCLPV